MDCDSEATQSDLLAPIITEEKNNHSAIRLEKNKEESIAIEVGGEEEKRETITTEIFSKLPAKDEIVLEILSRLPPKTVTKFKCVSKTISDLTRQPNFAAKYSHNYKPIASNSSTGFFHQRVPYPDQDVRMELVWGDVAFTPVIGTEPGCLPDPSLKFLKRRSDDITELIDSCNGLLLCSNTDSITFKTTCFVCNPLTREKVALPHPGRRSTRVLYSLIADFNSHGFLQYKVVCLFRPKDTDSGTELLVLSSEIGTWEEIEERLPELHHETVMGSKVFFDGSLFWDCLEDKILVCHLNPKKSGRCYDLIEAPRAPLGRCLWTFRNQLLCYCHGFADEFPSWRLRTNEKNEIMTWNREDGKMFETLSEDISTMNSESLQIKKKAMPVVRFMIIGYNPGSDMVFLRVNESVYSYGFEDRRLESVDECSVRCWDIWRFHSRGCVLAYKHSLGAIQIGKEEQERKYRGRR